MFGGVPMNLELRLSVEDSPNSAGVAIDMIRCAKLAERPRHGRADPSGLRLFLQAPADPDDRRSRPAGSRRLHRRSVSALDTAVLLAAGAGSRLRMAADSKPLCPVAGLPLIDHALERLAVAGVVRAIVVTGYRAEAIEAHLASRSWPLTVETVRTPDWQLPNGVSALAAAAPLAGTIQSAGDVRPSRRPGALCADGGGRTRRWPASRHRPPAGPSLGRSRGCDLRRDPGRQHRRDRQGPGAARCL